MVNKNTKRDTLETSLCNKKDDTELSSSCCQKQLRSDMPASTRIPKGLQAVFLASGRGNDVKDVPTGNVAYKTFLRGSNSKGIVGKSNVCMSKINLNMGALRNPLSGGKNHADFYNTETSSGSSSDSAKEPSDLKKKITNVVAGEQTKVKKNNFQNDKKEKKIQAERVSPQHYLDNLLKSRGYSTTTEKTVYTRCHIKPSPLQIASYHCYLNEMARSNDKKELKNILQCGISPSPCNKRGDSLLGFVCRTCDKEALQVLLNAGTSLQICDAQGRTPLHEACWRAEPCFSMIEMIVSDNLDFFHMTDNHGATPLSYVYTGQWDSWITFLESKKDAWWPPVSTCNAEIIKDSKVQDVTKSERHCISNPNNALKIDLAAMVAAGKLSPNEAILLNEDDEGGEVGSDRSRNVWDDDQSCEADDGSYDFDNESWSSYNDYHVSWQ